MEQMLIISVLVRKQGRVQAGYQVKEIAIKLQAGVFYTLADLTRVK